MVSNNEIAVFALYQTMTKMATDAWFDIMLAVYIHYIKPLQKWQVMVWYKVSLGSWLFINNDILSHYII